ncbi:hypothetical protein V1511DRAFT_510877 [Dipodascopsis uninucleata]
MLFTEESDGILQMELSRGVFNYDWFDKELNFEQRKAVSPVIERSHGYAPFPISKLPGTGKTKTIVKIDL